MQPHTRNLEAQLFSSQFSKRMFNYVLHVKRMAHLRNKWKHPAITSNLGHRGLIKRVDTGDHGHGGDGLECRYYRHLQKKHLC